MFKSYQIVIDIFAIENCFLAFEPVLVIPVNWRSEFFKNDDCHGVRSGGNVDGNTDRKENELTE